MNDCRATELADRGAVRVLGDGAGAFLQGLITNNIEKTGNGAAIHAGLLTPQGKVLFDFFVVPEGRAYLLECRKEVVAGLRQRLLFYRLRAKIEIEETSLKIAAVWAGRSPDPTADLHLYADPRLSELGFRVLMPDNFDLSRLGCLPATEAEYHARRIALCVPEGGHDYAFGDTFPHEALFDRLRGVDFRKGCFVGQEVVSRMEHRGTARKRIVGVSAEGPLPEPGTAISAGGNEIGILGSISGSEGLALIRLDRAEDARAKGLPLLAGETPISLRFPEWAMPTSAPAVEP